jgi:tetratricopeptide (TPR) repeat protein
MPLPTCRVIIVRLACCLAVVAAWASEPAQAASVATTTGKSRLVDKAAAGRPTPYQAFEGPTTRLERELFADAADGRLDRHTPLAAALIATGQADSDQIRNLEQRFDAWIAELETSRDVEAEPLAEARAIFEFMHRQMLVGGYRRDASDPGETLSSGRFNCASASLLYYCLATHFGLTARGLELPGHAMVRLVLADRTVDVETTCPRWFQLLDDPQAQAQLLARVRGKHPEVHPSKAREVTPIQMAAMIYYNRGIDLLGTHQFPEALAANAKALRLDAASSTARGNLLATLNNWSIRLGETREYAESVAHLEDGFAIDPSYPAFAANYAHVHYEWVHSLCHAKRFAEAVDVLQRASEHRPGEAFFRRALPDVHRRWAAWLFSTSTPDAVWAMFDAAYRRFGRQPDLMAAEMAASNDRALALLEQGQFQPALGVLDHALTRIPGATTLDENRRVAVMRWAEPAFHEGDYAEAIRRTTYGTQPGQLHPSLVNNVRYGYQQWQSHLQAAGQDAEARRIADQAAKDPYLAGR